MPGPASEAWLHWAVKKATADPYADMRAIEETGRQRFGRFSYSYCYHPPTRLWLVGAGHTVGAHTGGRNSRALGLSIIAAPGADDMPHLVTDTAWLLRLLIQRGELRPGTYPTGGHRDLKATECPGNKAYALIPQIRAALAGEPTTPSEEDDMPLSADDKDWFRKAIAEEVSKAIGSVWVDEATDAKVAEEQRIRDGSLKGWVVAMAKKLGVSREDAIANDPTHKAKA